MIPEDKLIERNTNALQVAAALIRSGDREALLHFGELLTEQHVSLRKSFSVMTSAVDDIKVQALRDEMETNIKKDLEKE
jgi:galactokinase